MDCNMMQLSLPRVASSHMQLQFQKEGVLLAADLQSGTWGPPSAAHHQDRTQEG